MTAQVLEEFKIREIQTFPVYLPFKRSHKISLGTAEGKRILVVQIRTTNEMMGVGEAIEHPAFSGETLETLKGGVNYLSACVVGESPLELNKINALMDSRLYGNYGAKGAVEMALMDLVGKFLGVPVYDLLGGKIREALPLSRAASQSDLEKDVAEVKEFLKAGYGIIKVKVGVLKVKQDIERVKVIRETVGPEVSLRADANQGWDGPTALQFIQGVEDCHLTFIEQPLPRWDLEGLAYLRNKSKTPIMADEAATTDHDVLQIIREKAADFISVKLIKSGGITRARRIATLAHMAGIKCYLGSQFETSIGTSASLHVALSTEGFDHGGEIYGPVFFVEDIVKQSIRIEKGWIYPANQPGLGVHLDADRMKEFALKP